MMPGEQLVELRRSRWRRYRDRLQAKGIEAPIPMAVMGCREQPRRGARGGSGDRRREEGFGHLIVEGEVKGIPGERFVEALVEEAGRLAAERAAPRGRSRPRPTDVFCCRIWFLHMKAAPQTACRE